MDTFPCLSLVSVLVQRVDPLPSSVLITNFITMHFPDIQCFEDFSTCPQGLVLQFIRQMWVICRGFCPHFALEWSFPFMLAVMPTQQCLAAYPSCPELVPWPHGITTPVFSKLKSSCWSTVSYPLSVPCWVGTFFISPQGQGRAGSHRHRLSKFSAGAENDLCKYFVSSQILNNFERLDFLLWCLTL